MIAMGGKRLFVRVGGSAAEFSSGCAQMERASAPPIEARSATVSGSLTGPDNDVLERAVAAIAGKDVMMVAAAGNKEPAADPIAYPNVTVATAVDGRQRRYRRAGRGEHIDFAAPGVNVWTAASVHGGRPKTGTSFAAPFITAAIAYIRAQSPKMTCAQVKEALAATVEDLGDPGRDSIFGWGLLRMDGLELAADNGVQPKQDSSAEPGAPPGGSVILPPIIPPATATHPR